MNLTLTQSFHRTQNLSGEIKAAQSALADCEADHAAKQRIASIAAEAVETARTNLAALEQEREDLAEHMAGLVRQVGDAPLPDAHSVNTPEPSPFDELVSALPDRIPAPSASEVQAALMGDIGFAAFGHPLQNGDDTKLNAAFE